MSNLKIEALLERYTKGDTSKAENELIERWLEQNKQPISAWEQLDQPAKGQWLASLFGEIKSTIQQKENKVVKLPRRKIWMWQGVAAAVVLVISFTLYLSLPTLLSQTKHEQVVWLVAPMGERKQLTLADGTRVWLNEGSTLKYTKSFEGKTREVYLSGEAFFDVAHKANKPFLIHIGKLLTTVLGTAFNVKEDLYRHIVQVTVTRGKVSVANGNKLLGIITPNQQLSVEMSKGEITKQTVNVEQVIAWQQAELIFEDVAFEYAIAKLQKQFNVTITFGNDKLKNCRFTGTALPSQTLEEILNVMCAFNNATYHTKADGTIVIEGKGCN